MDVPFADGGIEREWPGRGWIHECVLRQARRTPETAAVRFEGRTLTYRMLDLCSARLAHRLVRLGAGRGVLVGVRMERSAELIIAVLAVLRAGAAYVPLDPSYPEARLAFMIEDSGARLALNRTTDRDGLGNIRTVPVCLDDLAADSGPEQPDGPDVRLTGADLAYVIYTSGSTGRPKGVSNTHLGIRNRLLWMQDAYRLGPADRVLHKTAFSFDVSVWELFWPLMTGACVVVARPDGHKDIRYLVETVRDEAVTVLHFVPPMLDVWLREPDIGTCRDLRLVLCSGEVLLPGLQDRFFARCDAGLHNLYGPTEAAIDVTSWRCRPGPGPVPIGHPIANTRVHVLAPDLREQPVGAAGELCVAGPGVARGYLGRPGLTAERFVADPYGDGTRLYRTGDLARRRPDGAAEFLGRLDHQVKLRGHRIEPGEVETVLATHPGVHEAVVVARTHTSGDARLVGYFTHDGAPPEAGRLRTFLRTHLPEHMVPSVLVPLATLPLAAGGKIDRTALPAPEAEDPGAPAPAEGEPMDEAACRNLYLDLMKKVLANVIYQDPPIPSPWAPDTSYDRINRITGLDWPSRAHTMVGLRRLDNIQECVERVLADGVPGDLIETGVWRGGSCIFMRAVLKAYGITDRQVWAADSFQGMPVLGDGARADDRDLRMHEYNAAIAVPVETVRANFASYGLLDDQVRFVPGWFRDTLPELPAPRLALMRLDGDLYESTIDALTSLYPKLSAGGYVIIDDYILPACRQAVHDFRERAGIADPVIDIDGAGAYWRRGR